MLIVDSPRTVRKHIQITDMFISFLCFDNGISKFEDITVGIANSYFRRWYRSKCDPSMGDAELKTSIKKFFIFLDTEKGIRHEKVLKSFGVNK